MIEQCAHCLDSPSHKSIHQKNVKLKKRTKKNKRSRERSDDGGVSALLHDSEDEGNGKTTKDSRKRAHPNKRDVVIGIAIANVVEVEFAIEANKPAR